MAKTSIESADLLWIVRERLSIIDNRFKVAPIAIVPSGEGWEAITSRRYRKAQPMIDRCIERIRQSCGPFTGCRGISALLVPLQLALAPVVVPAIGIERRAPCFDRWPGEESRGLTGSADSTRQQRMGSYSGTGLFRPLVAGFKTISDLFCSAEFKSLTLPMRAYGQLSPAHHGIYR